MHVSVKDAANLHSSQTWAYLFCKLMLNKDICKGCSEIFAIVMPRHKFECQVLAVVFPVLGDVTCRDCHKCFVISLGGPDIGDK